MSDASFPPDDPEAYRMSVGEHLEELRRRMIYALLGLGVMLVVCLFFGDEVTAYFCAPLINTLRQYDVNPQVYIRQVGDAFMVFIKISLIVAAALASPWVVYQLWLFVAAGLYPNERKAVTRFIPLSLGLLISGMLFVYFVVLPWSLQFFIAFTINVPLKYNAPPSPPPPTTAPAVVTIPSLAGDPPQPVEFQIWFDTIQQRLKLFHGGKVRVIPFGPENLIALQFDLTDYIDLVLGMLLVFGLSFQLPLVVLALERLGITELEALKASRRYVYFALLIVACAITPGDMITASLALSVPLALLYELGIFLASMQGKPTS
jgi:sec-independent protein translocase protein TatC